MPDARLHVMDHPLILHKISMLRDKETTTKDFRQRIYEIALLIGCEATRDLPVTECAVSTPVTEAVGYRLPRQVCLAPILRAGLGAEVHPDVDIYLGSLDEKLNDHGYIVPGLGDAGDRLFGTL